MNLSFAANPINVQVESEFGARFLAVEQHSHVAGDARNAEQAGLAVKKLFDCGHVHLLLVEKEKNYPGIQRTAAGAHGQPSRAEKPMVLAMLWPPDRAHMLEPLPK